MIDYDRMNELKIDEWIWVIFIFLSIMNIFGDECEKDYCVTHSYQEKTRAKKIFTFTVFVSLQIYLYFEYQRYQHLQDCQIKQQDTSLWKMRCLGGFLVIIATLLFLYCQIVEPTPINPGVV